MPTLIFGIGTGLFLILILWVLALLIFLISLRLENKVGTIAILIVGLFTIILFSFPRASETPNISEKTYNQFRIWHIILFILMFISSIAGLLGYVVFELMETITPTRITSWVF